MARLILYGDFVGPGEKLTAAYLEQNLPDDWAVICNKELVDAAGNTKEADFILVGRNLVFVIEEKHWSGLIGGDEHRWYPSFGPVRSPISTVMSSVRRLAGVIQSGVPGIRDAVPGVFVHGRVILSNPNVEKRIQDPRAATHVLLLDGCEESLVRFDADPPQRISIAAFREPIVRTLGQLHDRPEVPERINDYTILEDRGQTGDVRTLLGQHADGSMRIIRLVRRPSTAVPELAEELENALLREYDALKVLAAAGRAPAVDPYFTWGDGDYWVIPIHLPDGMTLSEDRMRSSADPERIRAITRAAFTSLADVHDAGVLHRQLTPERIYIDARGRVGFSDFTLARITGRDSISGSADAGPDSAYCAGEISRDLALAVPVSDVYALAASLVYWISGEEPEGDGLEAGMDRVRAVAGSAFAGVIDECLASDPAARPDARLITSLLDAQARVSAPISTEVAGPNDLIGGQYRIIRVLGQGATAITYLALDEMSDQQFVLKRIENPELVRRLASNEFRILLDLNHPNLPRVYDVRPPGSEFHLKLEYVRGSSLTELAASRRGDVEFALQLAGQMLDALEYLEVRGLIHRDLSPSNILVPDEGASRIRVIDFGVATAATDTRTTVGTPRYRAPEVDRGGPWTPTADLYSLAVIVIELLTGRLPFVVTDGVARKELQSPPTVRECEILGTALLDVLWRAADSDPGRRFQTAAEFRTALRGTLGPGADVAGTPVVNPYVDLIRSTYRNTRIGNAGNRGLDSEFAVETYVESDLDALLLPRVLAGDFRLVVLSGNPGDGKTAFLQRTRERLRTPDAVVVEEGPWGWELLNHGHRLRALYDGSESDSGRTSDDLLDAVIRPAVEGEPGYTGLVAVNDGRLLQVLDSVDDPSFRPVRESLQSQLADTEAGPREGVVLVDLKRRSLVAARTDSLSLCDGVLQVMSRAPYWEACDSCTARLECPIRFNALSIADRAVGQRVRDGVSRLLMTVHMRRERRATMRDLRSAIAYLVTADIGCEDVHADRERGLPPAAGGARHYYNLAFDRTGSPDLVLDEWAELDPSDVATPALDRYMYFNRGDSVRLSRLLETPLDRQRLDPGIGPLDEPRVWLRSMKRRYWFEGSSDRAHELDVEEAARLTPHRYLDRFLQGIEGRSTVTRDLILLGLSRADGVPAQLVPTGLGLTMGTPTDGFVVVKVFRAAEFTTDLARSASYIEATPDTIVLRHDSGAMLRIGLDLFEFLARCAAGLVSGSDEQRALAEDVARFKAELLAGPTDQVVLSERGRTFARATLSDGKITVARA